MSEKTIVVLNKGGTEERSETINKIKVPDLWHIAEALKSSGKVVNGPACAELILEAWGLCHDLHRHINEQPD